MKQMVWDKSYYAYMEKSNHAYITVGIYGYCKMLLMFTT